MVNHGIEFSRSEAGIAQPWLSAPFGIYRTADGWIAIAMRELSAGAEVFDDPDLAELDAWSDRDVIKRRLDQMTPSPTTEDWLQALLAAGLWAAPVCTMKETADELAADGSPLLVKVPTQRDSGCNRSVVPSRCRRPRGNSGCGHPLSVNTPARFWARCSHRRSCSRSRRRGHCDCRSYSGSEEDRYRIWRYCRRGIATISLYRKRSSAIEQLLRRRAAPHPANFA